MALGRKTGGRQVGTLNKATLAVLDAQARLTELGCDPIEGMALIAMGDVPCSLCQGTGSVRFYNSGTGKRVVSKGGQVTECWHCSGRKREPVTYELRARMHAELAQYVAPKRKATEHTGKDGGPIKHELEVVIRPMGLG